VAYLSRRLVPLAISDQPALEQILGVFDRLETSVTRKRFRGCAFVNAVAEVGESVPEANKLAVSFKEGRRLWFRDLLSRLDVADPEGLATQLAILLDGAIAGVLVRGDAKMARAARDAAVVLIEAGDRKKKRRSRNASAP